MLRRMKMARSVFYYHRVRLDEPDGYEGLMDKITEAYEKSHRRYGYRRVCYALKDDGVNVNHKTVLKLMQQMGLKAKCKKRHYHSYKGDVGKIAPNVIGRDFAADKPNMKWATDVTQVCINDVKTYISPILDMFNGEIISYTISRSPNLKMVTDMLKQAFRKRPHLAGLIMHSDQGWHYQHELYQKLLGSRGIIQSMSRKGNCLDNSMMENFFAIMKNEMLYTAKYDSVEDFEQELRKYIWWYNNKRIKLRLKGMSPVQYRAHNREL